MEFKEHMGIGAVSASSAIQAVQQISSAHQDAQQFQRALVSGRASNAQAAFKHFQKDLPRLPETSGTGTSQPTSGRAMQQDLNVLQSALAAGDIAGAQDAFTKLKADLNAGNGSKSVLKISQSPDDSDQALQTESASAQDSGIEAATAERISINVYA